MILRDYQQRTLDDVMSTSDRVAIVSPTGSGKTVMGAAIAGRYDSVCWVAHRAELIDQARDALSILAPTTARLVTTIQSLHEMTSVDFDLLITDECHHYAADDWSRVTSNVWHRRMIGLSATPQRADGKGLKSIFDRIVVSATYSELLKSGHICPCKITAGPEDKEGLSAQPLEAWLKHGENRLTLAFAPTISLAEKWCEEFRFHGIQSECVFGKTSNRDAILQRFRDGATRVVWNVGVLTEGFDVPNVGCVLLARSVGNAGLYVQITGRGLRVADGKSYLRLIDLAGNYRIHGMPTEDRKYSLEGKAIRRNKIAKLRQCIACGGVAVAWIGKCPECGFVTPTRNLPVRVHSEELLEVFDGEHTPEVAKDTELERLLAECREKGHRIGWVATTYRKLFGKNPIIRNAFPEERQGHFRNLVSRGRPPWLAKKICMTLFGEL
jgi:superfamily II DNA or RNA helicase